MVEVTAPAIFATSETSTHDFVVGQYVRRLLGDGSAEPDTVYKVMELRADGDITLWGGDGKDPKGRRQWHTFHPQDVRELTSNEVKRFTWLDR